MPDLNAELQGLSPAAVLESRRQHGNNSIYIRPKRQLWHILKEVATDPMFILLVLACSLYFVIKDFGEAWLMLGAIAFVIAIEIIQEYRSEKAIDTLRQYTQPKVKVLRQGKQIEIPAEEVVVDDLMVFAEGERLAADGIIIQQNDLTIDEAVLTGESLPADKTTNEGSNLVFQGSVVASGQGIARVQSVGLQTEFGKLGKSIESIESEPTLLQKQINRFVRQMMWAGLIAFLLVFVINYVYEGVFLSALLFSLAFAMALIPQEIPVAFSTFMALGAYRMTRQHILVKQSKTVESLGSATVICLDKTGTITENKMSVAEVFDSSGQNRVLEYAMWASEPKPFDAMEKAIHLAYEQSTTSDRRPAFKLFHEYPLGGTPPMMTHIHQDAHGERIIAGKGAVERMLEISTLGDKAKKDILLKTHALAGKGYRILGVASGAWTESAFPAEQDGFHWTFEGLVALFDPPKKHISQVFKQFYAAGIKVKMITGDYPETALNIANESGLRNEGRVLNGDAVMAMTDSELEEKVQTTNLFARMFPAAKLRVVEALKANGEVVAMTGDGVNDGPALKAAQIGVAMGRRGTEIAKAAASMVLLDDNLKHMVTAIETGRRIYDNLRKAIRYIISIHLPIVLVVILPLVFGWPYLHLLMPAHVIFLELIMDPTCAVAFENEPAEPNLLRKPPRSATASLFSINELMFSLLQGAIITAGIFCMYFYAIAHGADEGQTRTFVFLTMLAANIFLTLANRSFTYTIARTLFFKNRLIWYIIGASVLLVAVIFFVPAMNHLFKLGSISLLDMGICVATAFVSVAWFELYKAFKKTK